MRSRFCISFRMTRCRRGCLSGGTRRRLPSRAALLLLAAQVIVLNAGAPRAGEEPTPARFFRAINLNGPPVEIDGRQWEGQDSKHYDTRDNAFENQSVPLKPPTDEARALMIRSSRWSSSAKIAVTDVPAGRYTVFVYIWEDNNSETLTLALNGKTVAENIESGDAGEWQRLGPWIVEAQDGRITLTSTGGAANISGIEIWQGAGDIPDPGAPGGAGREKFPDVAPEVAKRFKQHIAPLISRHCLECHNASDRRGGLDLSHWRRTAEGGESGPAIVPDKPEESLLWQYVEGDDMPRDRPPLSADEKRLLRTWIAEGAIWGEPRIDPFLATTSRRAGYDWWSLQPIKRASPPEASDAEWVRNDIDRFILARLECEGLKPSPPTDRRTLIRRLHFDVTGLPPSPEEIERFVSDSDPQPYERLVDRLLDSPHYGERWARHWLDVIRYGETQGYERNRIRENIWRYRDWVIKSLNDNLPFDEFIRRQIAGDVLYPDDLYALLATGYHVCGTWDQVGFLEGSQEMQKSVRQDHLEDLVATLGQAFLGLTVNCARCHDHKFDPISQREYYQMAALLGGVEQEQNERSGIKLSFDPRREAELRKQIEGTGQSLGMFEADLRARHASKEASKLVGGLQAFFRFEKDQKGAISDGSGGEVLAALQPDGKLPFASAEPVKPLVASVKQTNEFSAEVWITPGEKQQSGPARILTISADTGRRNITLGQDGNKFDVRFRTTKTDANGQPSLAAPDVPVRTGRMHVVYTFEDGAARLYVDGKLAAEQKLGGDLSNWDEGFRLTLGDELTGDRPWKGKFHFVALYNQALSDTQIQKHFETQSSDLRAIDPIEEVLARAGADERRRHGELSQELAKLREELGEVAFDGTAHVIIPKQPPVFHVLERGDYRRPAEVVAPAGLKAIAGLDPDFGLAPDVPEAQRRIKLAAWLTDRRNPLTARVFVNRVWYYHFGQGIVDTPSDFGFNGGRPSHPELLDYLAGRFIDGGWNVKELHRLILNSATFRQHSRVENERAEEIDADNRLLWRTNRQRLEGEAVRDAILAVSGALNPQVGGPSYRDVKVGGGVMGTNAEFTEPTNEFSENTCRRTIYRLWARSGNLPMLEALDCPDPTVMAPRRTETITPLQALSLMNNSFIEQCAQRFAERVRTDASDDVPRQIERAWELAVGRPPRDEELSTAEPFVREFGLEQLCLTLFNTNEFLFVE